MTAKAKQNSKLISYSFLIGFSWMLIFQANVNAQAINEPSNAPSPALTTAEDLIEDPKSILESDYIEDYGVPVIFVIVALVSVLVIVSLISKKAKQAKQEKLHTAQPFGNVTNRQTKKALKSNPADILIAPAGSQPKATKPPTAPSVNQEVINMNEVSIKSNPTNQQSTQQPNNPAPEQTSVPILSQPAAPTTPTNSPQPTPVAPPPVQQTADPNPTPAPQTATQEVPSNSPVQQAQNPQANTPQQQPASAQESPDPQKPKIIVGDAIEDD